MTAEADGIGLFGKVPAYGDFVSTGLSRGIETELVNWLQAGMQESELTLGRDWNRLFRAMPPWRFVVERALWGEATMVGVLRPSVDRVGRSFPLVLLAKIGRHNAHPRFFCFDESWFSAAETLVAASAARDLDINRLTDGLKRLRLPQARPAPAQEPPSEGEGVSLWWTIESDTGRARGFKTNGAPEAGDFLRIVKGGSPTVRAPQPTAAPDLPPAQPVQEITAAHGYATHAGTRLTINADALLISESPYLFAVADGIGDGGGAVNAAKITTNTLSYVPACGTIEALVQEVKGKLGRAHSLVQSIHRPHAGEAPSASIVTLALHADAFAVVWAGNARCYLIRHDMMRCLTRDHVEIGMHAALSRSVGSHDRFMPETVVDRACPGDRLLLCSAALARVLDERSIADIVLRQPAREAAKALVQDALIADVRENVSAVVIAIGEA